MRIRLITEAIQASAKHLGLRSQLDVYLQAYNRQDI